jgi:CXXX repeat radical SAM target protein
MTRKPEPGKKMDRRGFLKAGGNVIPALAVLGLALAAPQPARATDCGGTCYSDCEGGCKGTCEEDCMGVCKSDCEGTCRSVAAKFETRTPSACSIRG